MRAESKIVKTWHGQKALIYPVDSSRFSALTQSFANLYQPGMHIMARHRYFSSMVFSILSCVFVSYVLANHVFAAASDRDLPEIYQTRSGKKLIVSESHPRGRSLSDIRLHSEGFEHEFSETFSDHAPIVSVFVADLDENGYDEFYIVTVAAGSGSYGHVLGLASNRDRSLSQIFLPAADAADEHFIGYRGHDSFKVADNRLVRLFPLYQTTDTNSAPTGGRRTITYRLQPGEAAWQLRIETWSDAD